ncbi:hypothetical protein [Asticcacaulis sp.]|uniref:hypothetical protein n=1 Tax=Asticcacaulis sp. TaxID=1872648 RepID=UPI002612B02D|nr:hypothetical protein [Asticcacaulis sp.]
MRLLSDYNPASQQPYEQFNRLNLFTLDDQKQITLDQRADSYAITRDGQLKGFSTFNREKGMTDIMMAVEARGRSDSFVSIRREQTATQNQLIVEGLGRTDEELLISDRTTGRFEYIDRVGQVTLTEGSGRPLFDAYSHHHIGFISDETESDPVYLSEKWKKIWAGLKSMAPAETRLRVESHAIDARQLIASTAYKSGLTLYYFVDLSSGRTELLTRNMVDSDYTGQ